ncbi:MAG: hypothetical protein VKK59_00210 [Vampirovibrionales bacterium]|nr:hypothetical protein [Vampirovibrionales bacterium]
MNASDTPLERQLRRMHPGAQDSAQVISGFGWLGMLLPPPALPLVLLLIIVMPLSILTAESLLWPVIEWGQALAMGQIDSVPWLLLAKLIGFVLLCWVGLLMLGFRLTLTYYMQWVRSFPRPHALHVAYAPDATESMASLLHWRWFRLMASVGPAVLLATLAMGLFVGGIFTFSWLMGMPALLLPFILSLGLFVFMLLGLAAIIFAARGIWHWMGTVFGEVIAITEPWLEQRLVYARARRLAWCSPASFLFFPLYGLFLLWCVGASVWLIFDYDIADLLQVSSHWIPVLLVSTLSVAFYLVLNAMKLFAYHHALIVYYAQLPAVPPSTPYYSSSSALPRSSYGV